MITPDPTLFQFSPYGKTPILITPWTFIGLMGNVLFTARVLIQWIASEKQRKSIAPVTFWWASLAATLIMVFYSIQKFEIAFLLGYTINIIPYLRNLMLTNKSPRPWQILTYFGSAAVFLAGLIFLIVNAKAAILGINPQTQIPEGGGWIYLGLAGNLAFNTRFLGQWLYSERKGRSVLPLWFWIWSLAGQMLCLTYALIIHDLVFILGFLFNGIPILRNIILIARHAPPGEAEAH